jgi:hypothetical protein
VMRSATGRGSPPRVEALTPKQPAEIAMTAAAKRWKK